MNPSKPIVNTRSGTSTRDRLLRAALQAFGQHDYDAVSTRRIVDSAGVNIAAISYHFGGKKGLYLATTEFLADSLTAELKSDMEHIRAQSEQAGPEQCRRMAGELICGLARNLLTGEFGEHAPGLIFREQNQPTEAFDILYDKLFKPMHGILAILVAGAWGLPTVTDRARLAAHGLLGLAIVFRASRPTMLKHLSRQAYSRHDLETIQNLLRAMAASALDHPESGDPT